MMKHCWKIPHPFQLHVLPLGLLHTILMKDQAKMCLLLHLGVVLDKKKSSAFLSSRLSQLNPMSSGMLSQVGNPLVVVKLPNLMEKYGTPFFGVEKSYGQFAFHGN